MKRVFTLIVALLSICLPSFSAEHMASANLNITFPKFIRVESVLSPVLTANITDRTGNLHSPLRSKFRVISNSAEPQQMYLKARTRTDAGEEDALFEQGGQVYVAFGNIAKLPTSQSLANCKIGSLPKDSPNVVAYPVLSVTGTKNKFSHNKYEVIIENGTSYVTIDISPFVLKSSFAANDTRGFYQTVLSLTEADI